MEINICLIELFVFIVNSCGLVYDILYQSQHGEGILQYRGYPGKFKYLTFWCEVGMNLDDTSLDIRRRANCALMC